MSPDSFKQELDAPFSLTPEQITFYKENGFIRLKNVLSPALIAHYRPLVQEAVAAAGTEPLDAQLAKDQQDDTYAKAFRQVINCWLTHNGVREFAFGRRLARIAAELMQVDGVRIYHDQALFKAPSGGHTPWHADQFYWPLSSDKTVTVWVPLVPVPEEMGPMAFAAGSHMEDLGREVAIGRESDRVVGGAVEAKGYDVVRGGFELGEVSFHAGWTFHCAAPNASDATREVFTIIYMGET